MWVSVESSPKAVVPKSVVFPVMFAVPPTVKFRPIVIEELILPLILPEAVILLLIIKLPFKFVLPTISATSPIAKVEPIDKLPTPCFPSKNNFDVLTLGEVSNKLALILP